MHKGLALALDFRGKRYEQRKMGEGRERRGVLNSCSILLKFE